MDTPKPLATRSTTTTTTEDVRLELDADHAPLRGASILVRHEVSHQDVEFPREGGAAVPNAFSRSMPRPPRLYVTSSVGCVLSHGVTRAEWEALKKACDLAFSEFEARFPVSATPRDPSEA